jgi:hypothetical protein
VTSTRLVLTRDQILAFRQRAGGLLQRLLPGAGSLRRAAWARLQDSVPRAALLSIHARVAGTQPSDWEHPALVQVRGPHYSVFVVAAQDVAVFTAALLAGDGKGRRRAEDMAARLRDHLGGELLPTATPAGDAWILAADESAFLAAASAAPGAAPARFLPSGDAYWLYHGPARELLVPDEDQRSELWTSRVWPGALLVGGEIAGTWRRAGTVLSVRTWRSLAAAERDAVLAEAESLPLPGAAGRITVRWAD